MAQLPHDLSITVIAVLAVGFILLGIFYSAIVDRLGLDEGSPGHRFLSVAIGLMLIALVFIYRLARESLLMG